MGMGLPGAFGNTAMAGSIRQRLIDQLNQQQAEQHMAMAEREMKLRESDAKMRATEHGMALDQHKAALAERDQTAREHAAAKAFPDIGLGNAIEPSTYGGAFAGTPTEANFTPERTLPATQLGGGMDLPAGGTGSPDVSAGVSGTQAPNVQDATVQDAPRQITGRMISMGTDKQRTDAAQAEQQKMIRGRLMMLPGATDAQKLALEATDAGMKVPAGFGDNPDKAFNEFTRKEDYKAAHRPATPAGDESKVWVLRNGTAAYVPKGQVQPGDTPYDRTRSGNRPMLSSDANKIADLDNAQRDVTALRTGLGTTGASSRIGAALPNFVTEWTGVGRDAKKRQALIDRVKQVIGKSLEGGVLRKEDEEKYKLILPTIGDDPAVAKTKMDGLEAALHRKRQTELETLGDAGFDVERSVQRGDGSHDAKPTAADLIKKYGG